MSFFILKMNDLERRFTSVFPLSRFGMVYSHPNDSMTFTQKLEFCLRYSSGDEYAIDFIDGKEYRTPYPHVIIKLPGSTHSYTISSPRDAVYFQYSPEKEDEMRMAGLLDLPLTWQIEMTPEINTLINKVKELSQKSQEKYVADWMDIISLQIIEKLISQRENDGSTPQYIETGIRRIASYFNLNFTKLIDLDKLISENSFSRRNFFRHWKKFYDATPAEYIKELKLQHAKTLLQETKRPVYEISKELNLQNPHYFCSIYKKRFGITPHQYRKQLKVR